MIEPPLDRLNYYNGQRLGASDLKLEQQYHIRLRRWLNKALYKPGIASGLDISPKAGNRCVIVSPGLALDAEGREILLLEEETIFVPGTPHMSAGSAAQVQGPYLTIRYDEEPVEERADTCIPRSTSGKKGGSRAAWGGPAFVRAKPLFGWSDALPYDSSGEIVLGQVELTSNCSSVSQINTKVRRYTGAAANAKIQQYALEGERDVACMPVVDADGKPVLDPSGNQEVIQVTARINFHVRDRQPNAVTLYLRAEEFSPLHYTELGRHTHPSVLSSTSGTEPAAAIDAHLHIAGGTGSTHSHSHKVETYFTVGSVGHGGPGEGNKRGVVISADWPKAQTPERLLFVVDHNDNNNPIKGALEDTDFRLVPSGDQEIKINGTTGAVTDPAVVLHTHQIDASSLSIWFAGVNDTADPNGPASVRYSARSGPPITYVSDLRIKIDESDVTSNIVDQLKDADPTWYLLSEDKLGDGTASHPLADEKLDVPIKLDFLGISFIEGPHYLEFSVTLKPNGDANGGRIRYNLYVE